MCERERGIEDTLNICFAGNTSGKRGKGKGWMPVTPGAADVEEQVGHIEGTGQEKDDGEL